MEITGFDNVFFSNIGFKDIISNFEKELETISPNYIIDNTLLPVSSNSEERHERFYSKNQQMLEIHEEHGFNTKLNNEGCVYLIASKQKQFDFEIRVNQEIEPKPEFAEPDPYESRIIMNNSWQYTLVTPNSIDEEGVSKSIFDKLINSIKQL